MTCQTSLKQGQSTCIFMSVHFPEGCNRHSSVTKNIHFPEGCNRHTSVSPKTRSISILFHLFLYFTHCFVFVVAFTFVCCCYHSQPNRDWAACVLLLFCQSNPALFSSVTDLGNNLYHLSVLRRGLGLRELLGTRERIRGICDER